MTIVWLADLILEPRRLLAGPRGGMHLWVTPTAENERFLRNTTPAVPAASIRVGIDGLGEAARGAGVIAVHQREIREGAGWPSFANGMNALPVLVAAVPAGVPIIVFSRDPLPSVWRHRNLVNTALPERLGDVAFFGKAFAAPGDLRLVSVLQAIVEGRPPIHADKEVCYELELLHDQWVDPRLLTPLARLLLGAYGADRFKTASAEEGLRALIGAEPRPVSLRDQLRGWTAERR